MKPIDSMVDSVSSEIGAMLIYTFTFANQETNQSIKMFVQFSG